MNGSSRNSTFRRAHTLLSGVLGLLLLAAAACRPAKPANTATRYKMTGKVVSIDRPNQSLVINGDAVPGFMPAMAMPYKVKNQADLNQLSPGDSITGEIVVQNNDYWLENIRITAHASAPASKPTSTLHMPSRGEPVPDFKLINQSNRRASFHQYRGKVLLVTFIYTQCPFADFCPRVTAEFTAVNRQLLADSALSGKTHLLSISFDPAHDTPKALRVYGLHWIGSNQPSAFDHWEFAVPPATELPKIADFFDLTYTQDGGGITHSLSTAVIGPDGRIFTWYHDNEWKASDLVRDAAAALHSPS